VLHFPLVSFVIINILVAQAITAPATEMQQTFFVFLALRPDHGNVKKWQLIDERNAQA
jgi:hypothetical protein